MVWQIRKKFFLQIDFSNLPKWEEETSPDGRGALFQGLEAWEIDVFSLPQLFLENSRTADSENVPTLVPQPTSSSKWVGEPDYT